MEPEEPVQQGFLLFPPQGVLGHLKKTWHKKFCQLFKASKYGIERLEIYDNQEEALSQQHTQRIVTLDTCIKIAPTNNQSHVFMVVTKSMVYYFGCSSESDMTIWISAFQSVAFKDNASSPTIEEDNDLYCTSGEGIFAVKVVETEASKRCQLEAKNHTLVVAATDIKLMDSEKLLYTWPYRFIRRYGYREGKFTFEAGRKCESGEGFFCLEHSNQLSIFRCISSKMKDMKKLLNGETSPNIECNDAQFHAALSMEAGSRTPLPPSPNSSNNLIDLEFSSIAQLKNMNSSQSSMDSTSYVKPPPIIKPKPSKPPRKYFGSLLEKKCPDLDCPDPLSNGKYKKLNSGSPEFCKKNETRNEDDNSYDFVCVNNPENKEKPKDTESPYEIIPFPIASSHSTAKSKANSKESKDSVSITSPIIYNVLVDQSDYDKLQHFGTVPKAGHNPAYKSPNFIAAQLAARELNAKELAAKEATESNKWSNYEIVENMSAVRMADDSHHGYGMIRKKPAPTPPDTGPKHKVYNDSDYAIVSKPKRV